MSRQRPRRELVTAIIGQLRSGSTRSVLFHSAVAERLGLNASDHKCADLLLEQRELATPGRLAELTGLSTGAITGVLDRLERAGFVERVHDVDDRRRILLRVTEHRVAEVQELFAPLAVLTGAMCERFSADELETVTRFLSAAGEVLDQAMAQLRVSAPPEARELSARGGGRRAARRREPPGQAEPKRPRTERSRRARRES